MYLIHPEISAEIIKLGSISIRWYSLMYIFGFLFFHWWTKREILANRLYFTKNSNTQLAIDILNDIMFYGMIGILIGGRLGYALLYNAKYYFLEDPLAILRPWEGGMSFHGAFIGIYLVIFYFLKNRAKEWKDFNLLDLSDILLVSVPMGLLFGRIGNFINGELYGRPTAMPWGMVFPRRLELEHFGAKLLPIEQVQDIINKANITLTTNVNLFIRNGHEYIQIPRHPSQLYHVLLEGLLTLILQMTFYYKLPISKNRGFLTGSFFISYGCSRIFTEFFREPDRQIGFLFGNWLTAGMLYSMPMILIGIYFIYFSYKFRIPNKLRVK